MLPLPVVRVVRVEVHMPALLDQVRRDRVIQAVPAAVMAKTVLEVAGQAKQAALAQPVPVAVAMVMSGSTAQLMPVVAVVKVVLAAQEAALQAKLMPRVLLRVKPIPVEVVEQAGQ
jgi:hypothetical protein